MQIGRIFKDRSLKTTDRTEYLSTLVLDNIITTDIVIAFAKTAKDKDKATCLESLELVTKTRPEIINEEHLDFVIDCLSDKKDHVKWESARVIGNTIHLFPGKIPMVISKLLNNTAPDEVTVVRWSTAFAIAQILKLETDINSELMPAIEMVAASEEKSSIKKIYLEFLDKEMAVS